MLLFRIQSNKIFSKAINHLLGINGGNGIRNDCGLKWELNEIFYIFCCCCCCWHDTMKENETQIIIFVRMKCKTSIRRANKNLTQYFCLTLSLFCRFRFVLNSLFRLRFSFLPSFFVVAFRFSFGSVFFKIFISVILFFFSLSSIYFLSAMICFLQFHRRSNGM